ncbi:hypothetical protein DFH29DRAFT_921623 [Suillus ampliporus]|nr:hypothetical protein DFH29DRAFT_921623 [Suillus ampliporus]
MALVGDLSVCPIITKERPSSFYIIRRTRGANARGTTLVTIIPPSCTAVTILSVIVTTLLPRRCSRPAVCTADICFSQTVPIVQSFTLWIGLTWSVVFALTESFSAEFQAV